MNFLRRYLTSFLGYRENTGGRGVIFTPQWSVGLKGNIHCKAAELSYPCADGTLDFPPHDGGVVESFLRSPILEVVARNEKGVRNLIKSRYEVFRNFC